ncbi:uncharacterized protein LOC124116502 [Haliotis rufescens]|uniref:uncharacterized protein LOC124116502 n=1 Tax=Haliotis rufescens TaxID=6454 RepID=UPI00201F08CA|nr:uncharacterized protein LOC124116502 [Haliotis rufescens]XP_046333808.2 uncharacterized protein LOC124116502 [Haliotis rufescens]
MGATTSKRRKNKKRRKEDDDIDLDTSPYQDLERLRTLSKTRLNRLSAEMDRLSVPTSQYYSSDSLLIQDTQRSTMSLNRNLIGHPTYHVKGSFSADNLILDDHPVLTKLQNEQNARLEHMEQRITKIRTNAMQAAERRKYAHMFRAKSDDSRTAKLLKEASEALEALKREKKSQTTLSEENDKGEIIPVRILCEEQQREKEDSKQTAKASKKEELWPAQLQALNFGEPVTWLLLPFLLPLLLVIYLIRSVGNHGNGRQKKRQ